MSATTRELEADPFIGLQRSSTGITVRGTLTCDLGHVIDRGPSHEPDGVFVSWRYADGELALTNDRYGLYPCYYSVDGDSIRISPSIPTLIAEGAPGVLDDDALGVYLRLGFFLGDRTPFLGIRALPPGSCLTWAQGRLTLTARGRIVPRVQPLGRTAAMDAYIDVFRHAIARRPASPRTVVPLSGGRDSRHILLALHETNSGPFECLSYRQYVPRRNNDVEIAARLCERLGLRHIVLDQRESRLRAELTKNVRTSFCTDEHAQVLVMGDYLRGRTDTLFDGLGGDVLSGGLFLDATRRDLYARGAFDTLAASVMGGWSRGEDAFAALLTPEAYKRFDVERARASVVSELAGHADAPNPMGSFFFWNRTRREIALAPYAIVTGVRHVYVPYVDHDVYDLLASLPADLFVDNTFHTDAVGRAYPEVADIPYAEKGSIRPDDVSAVRRFAIELATYAAFGGGSSLVRRRYVLPRFLRAAADGDYDKLDWFAPLRALHLLQLERLCATLASRPNHMGQRRV